MDPFMTIWILLIGVIIGLIIGVTLVFRVAVSPLHRKIEQLNADKKREQLAAVMEQYPYPLERFRYIGTPVDGVQFEDDQILFVLSEGCTISIARKDSASYLAYEDYLKRQQNATLARAAPFSHNASRIPVRC